MDVFVVARAYNGHPTLQHKMSDDGTTTLCGRDVTMWSRAYQGNPIPQIYCKKCKRLEGR
jgi:hypothetical protein